MATKRKSTKKTKSIKAPRKAGNDLRGDHIAIAIAVGAALGVALDNAGLGLALGIAVWAGLSAFNRSN